MNHIFQNTSAKKTRRSRHGILLAGLSLLTLTSAGAWAIADRAPVRAPAPHYVVVERGPNDRTREWVADPAGHPGRNLIRHRYTELSPGMHYQENGKWQESREEIKIV